MKKNSFDKIIELLVIFGTITAGCEKQSLTDLDIAMEEKMTQYNIMALSLAIVKDEKLVYVQSYGFSDKEASTPASDENLFRIASISKPITAIAILKLVKDDILSLDSKVFGPGGILGTAYGTPPAGSKKDLITVRHLMEHKSGWTNSPNDPMFTNINYTHYQLITDLLANRPLVTNPGTEYYYLNFGYCVLGRVIEKVTNMTYENYVKSNLLQPCDISTMKIGGNTLNDRAPGEVKYYQSEFSPYNMNVTRMDSHGGWIASATDLARFIVRIDRKNSKADLLSEDLLCEMYFGNMNWYFYGSLPGTSSILCRLDNTFSFVLLANTRTESDPSLILDDLYKTFKDMINSISDWPSVDLF